MPAILIVEDEAKMRRLLELNLGEDGFTTLSAGDAEAVGLGARVDRVGNELSAIRVNPFLAKGVAQSADFDHFAVEALAQQAPRTPSSPLMVMREGLPPGGHEASVSRTAAHWAPIMAFLSASWRRNDAQLRKFPSQSTEPQAVLTAP